MSKDKKRIQWPFISEEECDFNNLDETLHEIRYSNNCFVLFSRFNDPPKLLFTALDKELFAEFVVLMSYHEPLLKFLKLAVITSDKLKKSARTGLNFSEQVFKYIEENYIKEEEA